MPTQMPQWYKKLTPYRERSTKTAVLQLVNTLLPYVLILAAMFVTVRIGWPYWSTVLLGIPAGLFLVRVFIFFHDCTHGSFTPSTRANRIIGFLTGILVFTPFEPWRRSHLKHHATNGQLDHRGVGDVETMTFEEYREASPARRLGYRAYRNPITLFMLGPLYTFVLLNRVSGLTGSAAERRSCIATDLGIAAIAVGLSLAFGFTTFAMVYLLPVLLGGSVGIWLFYVQHQFEPGYWARDEEWGKYEASMLGSSYYKLPPIFQWFSGSIGVHHIHHLQPRVPNYNLIEALAVIPPDVRPRPLTLWESLKSVRINLYWELEKRFLTFRQAHQIMRSATPSVT